MASRILKTTRTQKQDARTIRTSTMPHGKRKIRSSPRSLVHGAVSTEVLHGMGSRSIGCMEVHSEDGMTFFFAGSGLFSSSRSGTVGLVAGHESDVGFVDGCRTEARFDHPCGMVLDPTFQCMYVSDTNNHALRRIILTTGTVETAEPRVCLGSSTAWGQMRG